MTSTKTLPIPGQLRRHVIKNLEPKTKGEKDLKAACLAGHAELVKNDMSPLNTIDLDVTNDAIGAALDIARGWLTSDNGNNVMAGKSMLKFELEYEPDDPREIRHAIKMPKSVASYLAPDRGASSPYKKSPKTIREDMGRMSWTGTGASGRVRAETLGFILGKMRHLQSHPNSATQRAASKFIGTYTEPYEQTQRLINGYLGTGDNEDQAPEPKKGELSAEGFMEAIHGQGPELEDDEPQGPEKHPEDCRFCEAGEGSEHNYEPAPEVKDPLLDLIKEAAPPKGGYEVPANFLELAEEGNTPQARAYWKRRCEEYRRTGK